MTTDLSAQSCPRCQHSIAEDAKTCPNCGLVFSEESDPTEALSPTPAATSPLPETADEPPSTSEALEATLPDAPTLEASASQPLPDTAVPASSAPDSPAAMDDAPSPLASPAAPAPQRGSRRLKLALIGVAILLVLSATGSGITYVLTRPQPLISATSAYQVGSVPAGSATTTLQVAGRQFSTNSAITFLLDGQPAPESQIVPSDGNGNFEADLTITARWKVGVHQLTARDMNGNTTKTGVKVMVVPQGAAHTPGPNGAPADDTARFILYVNVVIQKNGIASDLGSSAILTVQGRPDPAGGVVCDLRTDDGQSYTTDYTAILKLLDTIAYPGLSIAWGLSPTKLTTAYTCSGTYQGAKISYTETNTVYQEVYSNGVTCSLAAPRIMYQLQGTFTSPSIARGTYNAPATSVPCSDGSSKQTDAETGTWTGILFSA